MRKRIFILFCMLRASVLVTCAQTLSPGPGNAICPGTQVTYTVTDIPGNELTISNYSGFASTPTTGTNSDGDFTFTVIFTDAPASITLYNTSVTGGTYPAIQFNVSTLGGITPAYNPPQPSAVPPYSLIYTIPPCNQTPFTFTGPVVYYQYGGSPSGTGMTSYDYLIPAGWLVNGTVSNGTTPITAGATVTLTPDPINGGILYYWALNNCNPALKASNKMEVELSRGPAPTVTVNGSSSLTVNCGVANPTTFVVNNTGTASCITGYQWSAPTGWLDANGNTFTSPFTTTTNTTTLTPLAFTPPSDVTVNLIVGGVLQTNDAYKETVSYLEVAPPTTITGPTPACGAGPFVYTINGLPAGSGASTFTITNGTLTGGTITQSSSGNTLSITDPNGAAYGTIFISASTPTRCGTASSPAITVYIGQPKPVISGLVNGETFTGTGPFNYSMVTLTLEPIIGYQWIVTPHVTISGQATDKVTFTTPAIGGSQSGDVYLTLQYETACGGWSPSNTYYFVDRGSGSGGFPPPALETRTGSTQVAIVASNHSSQLSADNLSSADLASDTESQLTAMLKVTPTPDHGNPYTIKSVVVFNTVGQVRKKIVFGGSNSTEYLETGDLPNGIYFLQILTSKGSVTEKYLVMH